MRNSNPAYIPFWHRAWRQARLALRKALLPIGLVALCAALPILATAAPAATGLAHAGPAKAAATTNKTIALCSWDRPGANAFTGDLVAAVDRYTDIPQATRQRLKQRMQARQYDELVVIERDSISGQGQGAGKTQTQTRYDSDIRDMHFGQGTVCQRVTRSGWPAAAQERGLVYCEGEHCLVVPTVCRNLSRLRRLAAVAQRANAETGGGGLQADGQAADGKTAKLRSMGGQLGNPGQPGDTELAFDAPSAGGGNTLTNATSFAGLAAAPGAGPDVAAAGTPQSLNPGGNNHQTSGLGPATDGVDVGLGAGSTGNPTGPGAGFSAIPFAGNPFGSGSFGGGGGGGHGVAPGAAAEAPLTNNVSAVPDAPSAMLFLTGAAALLVWRSRRSKRAAGP